MLFNLKTLLILDFKHIDTILNLNVVGIRRVTASSCWMRHNRRTWSLNSLLNQIVLLELSELTVTRTVQLSVINGVILDCVTSPA